jgi:putative membrane protein
VKRSDRYPLALLGLFTALWIGLAVHPWYRQDWLLENVLVLIAVPTLAATSRSLRLSNLAYTCLFVFFTLHCIGAHYTYSEVPWREWFGLAPTGRNHYDRFVHFAYGLLLFPATWDLFAARAQPQRIWRYLFPLLFLMSHSVIYELIEWVAAEVFGGELGQAYLGTQGDAWDAQKDMGLAALGAVAGLTTTIVARRLRHDRHHAQG